MGAEKEAEVPAFVAGPYTYVFKDPSLKSAKRCAGCTRLVTGDGIIVNRVLYCSIDCVREARRAKDVPGHYLG